jgi:protein-S-isoprenylcysteine O-methyltransferase Ste14
MDPRGVAIRADPLYRRAMATPSTSTSQTDHPGVVVFPPLLFLSCLAAGLALHWFVPLATFLPWSARVVIGGLALVVAAVLGLGGERALHGAGTNVRPDRPTTAVVTSGIYRYTRNPLYLALLHLYTAIALFADSLWPFAMWAVLLPVLVTGVVAREERYLERKFGEPYRAYTANVRRWF